MWYQLSGVQLIVIDFYNECTQSYADANVPSYIIFTIYFNINIINICYFG